MISTSECLDQLRGQANVGEVFEVSTSKALPLRSYFLLIFLYAGRSSASIRTVGEDDALNPLWCRTSDWNYHCNYCCYWIRFWTSTCECLTRCGGLRCWSSQSLACRFASFFCWMFRSHFYIVSSMCMYSFLTDPVEDNIRILAKWICWYT